MYQKAENQIDSWGDLERFGIESLTGEACGLSMRLLCDISPVGVQIIEELLSVKLANGNNSWNHSHLDGWKSIMLPRGIFWDLAVFCLAKDGYTDIVYVNYKDKGWNSQFVQGFESRDKYIEWKELADNVYHGNYRWFNAGGTAMGGLRNQHMMSGRVK